MLEKRRRILIVDDDDFIVEILSMLFTKSEEVRVLTFNSGKEALRYLHHETPDVVILDYHLPDMNGTDLIRMLRSDRRSRHVPVIVLSGFDDAKIQRDIIASGADEFFLKPFNPIELKRLVDDKYSEPWQKEPSSSTSDTGDLAVAIKDIARV